MPVAAVSVPAIPAAGTAPRRARSRLAPLALAALLGGCDMVVMNPVGDVALQQRNLIIFSTVLMLLIVLPVIVVALVFAWRYRATNTSATYEPDWDHSTQLELLIWAAPLLIVICLGAATWTGSHLLDPYRPLGRIAKGQAVPRDVKPLDVQVVSLDWKWLFIYPQQGVATVNALVLPVGVPVRFRLTSASVMNSFFVPRLGSQIYTMNGMETQLNLRADRVGRVYGQSSMYSGDGFSDMNFVVRTVPVRDFGRWAGNARAAGPILDARGYVQLARQSQDVPAHSYRAVQPGLFDAIVRQRFAPAAGPKEGRGGDPHVSPGTPEI